MSLQHRGQIHPRHQHIVAHVVLTRVRAEVRRHRDVGRSRDVAGSKPKAYQPSRMSSTSSNAQVCPVIPHRVGEVTSQGVDQNLVLIELKHNIGQPPESLALQTFPVAGRSSSGRCLDSILDRFRDLGARRKSQSSAWYGVTGQRASPSWVARSVVPENIRIVSIPERNWSVSLGPLGVVGRDGMGVTDLEITPFSLVSLPGPRRR